MKHVKFYARGDFGSIEQQQWVLKGYLETMDNVVLVDTYEDVNQSANNVNRPGLNKMLNELEKGDVVLVSSLDRLARNIEHFNEIEEKIKAVDGTLISAAFGSEVTNRLSLSIFKAFIEIFDNNDIADYVKNKNKEEEQENDK